MRLNPAVDALLDEVTSQFAGRNVVFDADGTLWRGDVGEDFLRYALHKRLFEGSYETYERLLAEDHARAFAWSVQTMRGVDENRLLAESETFFRERFRGRVFGFVGPLLARLTAAGCQLWICSASPRWMVLPGAHALGVPDTNVIGVTCSLDGGALTGAVDLPVPVGPGKVTWLERKSVRPALAVGNGDADVDMLASADRALVIAPPDSSNRLVATAIDRRWPILRA